MKTLATLIFIDSNIVKQLFSLHDKCVAVIADKVQNNILFVCKSNYINCLINVRNIDNKLENSKYISNDTYRGYL